MGHSFVNNTIQYNRKTCNVPNMSVSWQNQRCG